MQVELFKRQVQQLTAVWVRVANRQISSGRTAGQTRNEEQWTLPATSFTRFNFDASFIKETKAMGCGLIGYNDAGMCEGAFCMQGVAQDEEQAEV